MKKRATPKEIARALERCLNEVGIGLLEARMTRAFRDTDTVHGWDFFRLSSMAIFNDMVAHAMKVLEEGPKVRGFWYLLKHCGADMEEIANEKGHDLTKLSKLWNRLKRIRNQTHFHLGSAGVADPKKIWHEADVTFNELFAGLQAVFDILDGLHERYHGERFEYLPSYQGEDIETLLEAAQNAGIIPRT